MANPRILERLRKAKTDWSQEEFAKKLGLSKSTYQRLIEGSAPFTIDQAESAAKLLKVSIEEILYDEHQVVSEPDAMLSKLETRKTVTVSIPLDGTAPTLKYWIEVLKRMNAAMA